MLVTGGARGITAAIAEEFARRLQPKLFIVGRSPLPADSEAAETAGLTSAAEIKAAIIARMEREGRPPVPAAAKALAKRLYRNSPKTGKRPSLRAISQALTEHGFQGPSGRPYGAESVKRMVSANV